MVKLRAKNLLALALSILMLTGTVTDWLPTALAVEEPSAVTEQAAQPEAPAAQDDAQEGVQLLAAEDIPPRQLDFQDSDNGRPNLYVDFLGDNIGNGTVTDPGHLVRPADYNKDNRTNKISENTWRGYTSEAVTKAGDGNIIFWVGVGVDRTQVWELLKNSGNKGLTSLELGFYYNKKYIEPYTGGDFAATLTSANINGAYGHNYWGENYQILHAETDLPVEEKGQNILRADPITLDELENPSLDNIRANRYADTDPATDADWRMTYVSLELKEEKENAARRFAGVYEGYQTDANGEPVIPPAAPGTGNTPPSTENPPQYLLMIPFVVHQHDAQGRLCLRLVRDASHFSIGAGNDGVGDNAEGSYAAWERVTTRNEGKDLKLQLRFAGDLNIWNVDNARVEDKTYTATLLIQNGGGSQNTARLSVQGDTGGTPVFVDRKTDYINHLQGGTGMQLDLTVQSGYKATVWVYYEGTEIGDDGKPVQMGWPFVTVTDQEHYTFVMPNRDVIVQVVFQADNTRDFTLYLSETPKPYATGYMLGNETTVSSFFDHSDPKDPTATPDLQPVSINSFDPRDSHPNDGHGDGPKMKVTKDQKVEIDVSTHPDYEARVYIYNFNSQKNVQDFTTSAPDVDHETDADGISTIIVLPFGGTVSFPMPQSDVDVVVVYKRADTKTAKLEVYHDPEDSDKVKDINIAQLAYLSYDNQAAVSTAYSGQVYEWVDPNAPEDLTKRNHSAVKQPSYKTPWVPYSAATVSNSLGGDTGRTGRIWSTSDATGATSLMTALANATSESNLASRFNALDLMGADLLGDGSYMGLRKNLDGEPYGDGELADAAALLWELRCKIMADVASGGGLAGYYKTVTLPDTTFHYFDLTPAQIQAYRIDCLEVAAIFRANQQAYRKAYQTYQEMKQIYDLVDAVIRDVTAPIAPLEPLDLLLDTDAGLRQYQGTDYQDDYIADYTKYIDEYKDFITALRDAEGTPTATTFARKPKDRPDRVAVELLPDDVVAPATEGAATAAVKAAITKYSWDPKTEVKNPSATIETTASSAVSTRAGRTVWLLLEADSAYEVDHIALLDEYGNPLKDPATGVTLEAKASTSFKNVYTFSMPEKNCVVQVWYKPRSQRNLLWQVIGADSKTENVAHIEAYQVTNIKTVGNIPTTDPQWGSIYPVAPTGTFDPLDPNASLDPSTPLDSTKPTLAKRTNEGHVGESPYPSKREEEGFPVEGLLVGSQVTVRLTRAERYTVRVTANNGSGGTPIYVDDRNAAAGIYTFTVPEHTNPDVVLTIEYVPENRKPHNAHIRVIHGDGSYSSGNTGLWDNGLADINVQSGDELHGNITLVPGYYIDTSYALGPYGSCPYTLDGNGYNNSLGAGSGSTGGRATVKLESVMPEFPKDGDELWVYIVVKKGLPPEEPGNALTVVVVDEDNTGSPLADNWAKATVYKREDDTKRVELDTVSKKTVNATDGLHRVTHDGRSGNPIMTGDRVELDLSAANTFYVAEVALGPSYLGGDLEWLPVDSPLTSGNRKLQFTMPAGSTTVTVRFRKLDESITSELPSYYVHAQKIETDRNGKALTTDQEVNQINRITTATSGTIQRYAPGGIYPLTSANQTNPEQVPSSESGRGAGVAGETVTMTFQVDKGWYVQSVAVMTDGSARPVDYELTSGDNNGGGGTFTADLVMPSGDAWFIVKYRQCPENQPRPEIPEYAITLMVIDDDNTGDPPDPNTVTAAFVGDEGFAHSTIRAGGNYDATAIQYIHAGDRVRLSHDLAPGYTLDYMIVNPTEQGIVPTYLDSKTSQFTMPARNITVIAKIVKGKQQQYTADLILRPPAGMDINEVGQGTFTNNGGSLDDYYANAIYSLLLDPGKKVDFDLYAFDGYYIRAVTVEPAVGADPSLTGSYGYQSGGFVMPAANVYVNVYFEKKWPQRGDGPEDDGAKFDLTLKVHDASAKENNYAYFDTYGGTAFPPEHQAHVHGGETHIVRQTVRDGQEICVTLNRETGFYYDPSTIHVTDTSGAEISWRMTATGIAFLMPPRSTTVEITFRKDNRTDAENPARLAVLHINGTVKSGEGVKLYRKDGTNANDYTLSDGGTIGQFGDKLRAGDLLHLNIEIPDASKATRRVAAVYAVDEATGDQLMLPVTQVSEGGLNSFPVPTLPAGADATKHIHVYVTLADKGDGDVDQTMTLVVQGPSGSGTATLFETEKEATNTVTATAGATGGTPPNAAVGSIHAKQGSALTVNLDPVEGYYISQLTVTDRNGNKVDYDWISMVEDENSDPTAWYPDWTPNYDPTKSPRRQQITLLMPAIDGTVQVTYAKIPTDPDNPDKPITYRAQVVVNDDEYVGDTPSQNNAWLSVSTDAAGDLIRKKLVEAKAGDWVDLDIVVQAGYRIMPIFVSPQSFGIKPQLYLGDLDSQTTGFVMPAGDVTVYVRFVRDNLPIYNATLVVEGFRGPVTNGLGSNHADIHSDRTGTRGPIDSSKNPVSVQAAATREWVTVTYDWDPDTSWVSSVTVKDRAGRNVPFTQVDEHTITLPMVARDIIITVTYEDKTVTPPPVPDDPPTPELTPVRLHVIDVSTGHVVQNDINKGWARVLHNGQADTSYYTDAYTIDPIKGDGSTGEVRKTEVLTAEPIAPGETDATWGNTETIWVPAGRTVNLEAFSDQANDFYIESAYVLYRDGGQMINCNLKLNQRDPDTDTGHEEKDAYGFYWHRSATFEAHPDYNDVYVFLTKGEPDANKFTATLMLKSPAGDTGSAATIWTGTDLETTTNKASVRANGDHGRITAERKDLVTVTVTPMDGYAIDYILMTPLGIPITPKRVGNTYTFTMPGYNVNACVYLKRSNEREFNVRVHYSQQWDPNTDLPGVHNSATVSWSPDGIAIDSRTANLANPNTAPEDAMIVTENATVTLDVTLDDPYVVLAAYALRGGAIVPLAPALEGTAENRSMTDNSLADGTATFTMPGGDVDVYVVTTNDPPKGVWYTAVLTVQDPNDSGISKAHMERDNTIDNTINDLPKPRSQTVTSAPVNHKFISVREGQKVTIVVEENDTYTFDRPAQLTHAGSYSGTLRPISSSATEHVYEFTVGNCNSAVLANFKAKDAETNPLTVVVEDPDNPGNSGVRQTTTVTAGTLPTLSLVSESYLGAYQVIPNVEDGSAITLRAEAHPGYKAYAYWSHDTVRERIILTQTGNVYTGDVTMPAHPAQITVTYYKTYTATITIHDRNAGDQSSSATMKAEILAETDFPSGTPRYESLGSVTVNQSVGRTASISDLDTDTKLTTTVSHVDSAKIAAVLATDASGTHFLSANEAGQYLWTVDKSDVDIVVIVDAENTTTHVASVVTKGKPASAADPTIAADPVPGFNRSGSIWCTADENATVTVTVPPVEGYQVTVTARKIDDNSPVTVTAGAGNTYTATMPDADLEFTVTYVKEPTLTLRVLEPASTAGQNATSVTESGETFDLTKDGDTHIATADGTVTVSATPSGSPVPVVDALGVTHNCPVVVKEITYRTPTNTYVLYTYQDGDTAVTKTFTMPDADVTVVVRYGLDTDGIIPGPDTPDDEEDYYTAWVETAGDDDQPENRVDFIRNVSVPNNTYPSGSPDWACGAKSNEMKLSISVKAGYYVTVTAETRNADGSKKASVPVIQQGDTGLCAASVIMPGEDVFITVTYHKITPENPKPEPEPTEVTLVLVGHGGVGGNSAAVTGGSLSDLFTNGDTGDHMIDDDPTSRVYVIKGTAKAGEELRLSANWAADKGYQITRATLSLPTTEGNTPAMDSPHIDNNTLPDCVDYIATELALSRYGTNATARLKVPGKGAVITVYYDNSFEATFHVVRNGTTGDETHATDDRAKTVTSTGSDPIYNTGDKLISMTGGEEVRTTADPDTANGQRLVGVVWESKSGGASSATPLDPDPNDPRYSQDKRYDFEMPEEDVDFYAVYEPEPADPKDRRYIAKVRFGDKDEHLGDSGNAVTITNTSDPTAAKGAYWTAAKKDEIITINVKVADGYKAKITSTIKDNITPHATDGYDFYINRVNFLPNLILGKDATFTMPADTDATVVIEYIKGYDLELEVADTSGMEVNQADVTATGFGTLHGESNGLTNAANPPSYTPDPPVVKAVAATTPITTAVTPASDGTKTAPYKVYQNSLFTGTTRVDMPTGTPPTQPPSPYLYDMPSADVKETVLFYNEETPLLAKVELRGESDINGNSATPIVDVTDPVKTTTGTVWTTTADGNTIDLTITVAKGYVAKIKVRRDDSIDPANPTDETNWIFLKAPADQSHFQRDDDSDPSGFSNMTGDEEVQLGFRQGTGIFGDYISDSQHFRFEMPSDGKDNTKPVTDVTVIVEFVFAGTMPQPFDPDNWKMENIDLDRGFIYGENRGDFALIDIPTLYQDSNHELFSTNNYDKPNGTDPQRNVKFSFFLYNADRDEYTPLTLGVDVLLEPEDELTANGAPYNYYNYETNLADEHDILDNDDTREDTRPFTGSRFKLVPTGEDETTGTRTDGAQALYDMLNDKKLGSLEEYSAHKYRTRLYVMAEDAIGQKSAYTQVWVRPYFTITAQVISYAPNHTTTASLYKLMDQDAMDLATGYKDGDGNVVGTTQTLVDWTDPTWAMDFAHYRLNEDDKPYLSNYTAYEGEVLGEHKYYQAVDVMSSELLGPYTNSYDPGATNLLTNVDTNKANAGEFTYALTLEKTSSLTYTRVKLNLWEDVDTDADTLPSYYDLDTLTYTISDFIYLITGDVDGDGLTGWQDYDTVYTYVWRNVKYDNTVTKAPEPADPNYTTLLAAWRKSIYNPDTMAYRCDLNGDGVLTVQDVNIVQTVFDYNRSAEDYAWTKRSDNSKVLPFGFGKRDDSGYAALFALREMDDVFPMERDEYWDSLVDPDTTEAPPLNTVYVDEDGSLWEAETLPEENETPSWPNRDTGGNRRDDAVMEIPVGDEVMEWPGDIIGLPVFDPGPAVDLPFFDPEEPALDLPQNNRNGPGENPAETPADITSEE